MTDEQPGITRESIERMVAEIWNAPPQQVVVHPLHAAILSAEEQFSRGLEAINAVILAHEKVHRPIHDRLLSLAASEGMDLEPWQVEMLCEYVRHGEISL